MSDDWRQTITVKTVGPSEPDVKYPRFVDGKRRGPPEDVGGLPGFGFFLDDMADPAREEHDRLRDWYGGPYNPDDIDKYFVRRAVVAIALRRHAGKLASKKSRPHSQGGLRTTLTKDWRRVATHYDRCPNVFFSAVALAATIILCSYQRVLTLDRSRPIHTFFT